MATMMPNNRDEFPRGDVIWDNTQILYKDKSKESEVQSGQNS